MTRRRRVMGGLGATLAVSALAAALAAQAQMPNPREMSGSILPVADLPVGTISVRVIRGGFDKNLVGQPVDFLIDGKKRTVPTDANGRAEVRGLARGARVTAETTVDGERLVSQAAVVAESGLRIILVATDPEAEARAAEDKKLAAAPPVKGAVVFGPESRVVAEMSSDRLHIYYILQILNTARTPVDIGGPLIFDLPREARGAVVLEGSTKQATASGPRLRVVGPFAPGVTVLQAAYELPYGGDTARVTQVWPASLQPLTILVQQIGGLALSSAQVTSNRTLTDQGQPVILATGPGLGAGETLRFEISGLPHHARWPRNLALSLAACCVLAGIWGAVTARPRV